MRTSSPAAATTSPMRHIVHVGRARISVARAAMNPSATRLRASHCATASLTRRDPALNGAHDLGDADIVDASLLLLARSLVHTRTVLHARDRDVVETPRAVAVRTRWTVRRHGRRAAGRCGVYRTGTAGGPQPRAARDA